MTIITDLYNKVLNFFNSEAKEQDNSKSTACNRLKLVLMQDRAKLEPDIMEKLRSEMIDVISKYIEIDTDALGLNLEAEGESFALMLNIPVIRAKTREEIEEAEKLASGIQDDGDDDDESDDIEENEFGDEDPDEDEEIDEDDNESEEDEEDNDESKGTSDDLKVEEASSEEMIEDDLSDDEPILKDDISDASNVEVSNSTKKEVTTKRKKKEKVEEDE